MKSEDPNASNARDYSVSLATANRRSLLFAAPPVILVVAIYILVWGRPNLSPLRGQLLLVAGLFVAGVILHEAIHGLVWAIWGTKSFATIKFGMNLRALAPYAHATVPMKASAYRLGAISPALVLGAVPSLVGILTNGVLVMVLGVIFLAAAAGDYLVLWLIRKVPADALVQDHPTKAGCLVFESNPYSEVSSQ